MKKTAEGGGTNALRVFHPAIKPCPSEKQILRESGIIMESIYGDNLPRMQAVMDEVLGLVDNHIITTGELGELLGHRGETEVILTGITLDDEMLSYADEISEISPVNFRKFGSAEKEQDTEGGNHVSI